MIPRNFIQSFITSKGQFVLLSVFLAKLVNFVVAILVIRLLTKEDYGHVAYGLTILSFLAPFVGAGMFQGYLRFGALSKGQLDKKVLFGVTFKKGLIYSLGLAASLIVLSPVLTAKLPGALYYLALLSIQLISLFIFQMIQVYCRLIHRNKLFAIIDIQNSLLLLIFNVSMCYLFGGLGYVISMICIPLILGLYYVKKLNLIAFRIEPGRIQQIKNSFAFSAKEFFYYGLFMSMGGVLSQLLFAVDIILIGNLLIDPELVAQYKASSIIPFSLLIIGSAVLTTDFVKLAAASQTDKKSLGVYYGNYLKIFIAISIAILVFFYFFSEPLIGIFGDKYKGHPRLMWYFAIGVVGGLLFRVPMGNMLSAIGWPRTNALFSVIILVLNVAGSYYMILRYGIEGAAITTSALMWLSGLLSLLAFLYFLKKSNE